MVNLTQAIRNRGFNSAVQLSPPHPVISLNVHFLFIHVPPVSPTGLKTPRKEEY